MLGLAAWLARQGCKHQFLLFNTISVCTIVWGGVVGGSAGQIGILASEAPNRRVLPLQRFGGPTHAFLDQFSWVGGDVTSS